MSNYKTVLVTGASAGFGKAICENLATNGFKVVALARRLEKLQSLANAFPGKIYPLALDVRDVEKIPALLDSLPEEFKTIDVLVNNAGLALGVDRAQNCSMANWKTMVETNITGLLAMTNAILPNMIKRNCGYIINLGSTAGNWPYSGGNVYGATKAFVEQFSRNLRCDTAGSAVKVTVIKPGLCQDTEFSYVRLNNDKEKVLSIYDKTESILPEDIANTVLWLLNTPAHLNINTMEMMPVCQTFGGLSVTRNLDLEKK